MSNTDDEAKSVRQHTHINLSNVAACTSQVLCALPHTCVIVPREATACFDFGDRVFPSSSCPFAQFSADEKAHMNSIPETGR